MLQIHFLQVEKVNLGVGKGLTQHVEVSKTTSRYFFTQEKSNLTIYSLQMLKETKDTGGKQEHRIITEESKFSESTQNPVSNTEQIHSNP